MPVRRVIGDFYLTVDWRLTQLVYMGRHGRLGAMPVQNLVGTSVL